MARTQEILATPRGRFLCANMAFRYATGDRVDQYRRPRTSADVQAAIRSVDVEGLVAADESELLGALGYAVDFARYWQPPDEEDIRYAAPEIVALLEPVAGVLLRHPVCAWWDDPVDLAFQRYPFGSEALPESALPYRSERVRWSEWRAHVEAGDARSRRDFERNPHRAFSDEWWSTPYAAGDGADDACPSLDGVRQRTRCYPHRRCARLWRRDDEWWVPTLAGDRSTR